MVSCIYSKNSIPCLVSYQWLKRIIPQMREAGSRQSRPGGTAAVRSWSTHSQTLAMRCPLVWTRQRLLPVCLQVFRNYSQFVTGYHPPRLRYRFPRTRCIFPARSRVIATNSTFDRCASWPTCLPAVTCIDWHERRSVVRKMTIVPSPINISQSCSSTFTNSQANKTS